MGETREQVLEVLQPGRDATRGRDVGKGVPSEIVLNQAQVADALSGLIGKRGLRKDSRVRVREIAECLRIFAESPEKINEDPYGEGWMYELRPSDAERHGLALREEQRQAPLHGVRDRPTKSSALGNPRCSSHAACSGPASLVSARSARSASARTPLGPWTCTGARSTWASKSRPLHCSS